MIGRNWVGLIGAVLLTAFCPANAQERPRGGAPGELVPPPVPPVQYLLLPERAAIAPVVDCARLRERDFAGVKEGPARVLSATLEPAHDGRAEFCLVKGYVAPTIQFELRLPTHGYTGRYLQGGCGGNCGRIPTSVMPQCDNRTAFSGAFALGFEDSGHVGGDGVWSLGGEQVRIDFAYRAAHAFSAAAKAIVGAYYGRPPAYSYFEGCSDGGREALAEAQRYPKDFDGIVAGAAPNLISEAMERFLWEGRWGTDAAGKPVFDQPALVALHAAVMQNCDGLDGLKDGQIDDPRQCRFDPATIRCGAPVVRAGACLTAEQADVARRFYQGPVDAAGRHLYPGGEPYGSELSWGGGISLARAGGAMLEENVRTMIFQRQLPESVTLKTWKWDAATLNELHRRGALYDTDNPDLRPFRAAGGKMVLWYGLADSAAGADSLPDYYQRVRDKMGGLEAARGFVRMFPLPGVYHCGAGYLPYQADMLGTIVNWVERGSAPDKVVASAFLPGGGVRTRPIFAYPTRAAYSGRGSIDDAANFVGRAPAREPDDHYRWLGAPSR